MQFYFPETPDICIQPLEGVVFKLLVPICGQMKQSAKLFNFHCCQLSAYNVQSQVQAADMGFLRKVYGATIREKTRSCEICKALNVETLLRIETSDTLFRLRDQNAQEKLGLLATPKLWLSSHVGRSRKTFPMRKAEKKTESTEI